MGDTAAAAPQVPSFGIQYNVTTRGTLMLEKVDKFGSAGKAGLAKDDEIFALNGQKIPSNAKDFVD